MTDEELFTPLSPANPAAAPKKCRQHVWFNGTCKRCSHVRDEAVARRNRNNAKRGKAIQRRRITGLGGQNLPGNKPNHDGIGLAFSYESKSGKAGSVFSERYWSWLKGIPVTAAQTAILLVTEAGAVGRRARGYVVVDYDDWRDLHGELRDSDAAIQPVDPYLEDKLA